MFFEMKVFVFHSLVIPFLWLIFADLAISIKVDEIVQNSEFDDDLLPEVSRRGYAGDDFYQKASKSIPRMGRRSESNTCICKPFSEDDEQLPSEDGADGLIKPELYVAMKNKRSPLTPEPLLNWPWYSDRIRNPHSKRTEKECFFTLKYGEVDLNGEVCSETLCCVTDETVFKRYLSTRSSKQPTTSAPDYKSNRFR